MIQFINFLPQVGVDKHLLQPPAKTEVSWELPTFISFGCIHCNHKQEFNLFENSQESFLSTPDIPDKELVMGIARAFLLSEMLGGGDSIYYRLPFKDASVATISLFDCNNCGSQYMLCWAEGGDYSRSPHMLYIQGIARVSALLPTIKTYFKKSR